MSLARHRPQAATGALLTLLTLAVLAPGAAANIPDQVTKTNTVQSGMGDMPTGTLMTTVTYTDTTATAVAVPHSTVGLNKGFYFRLRTCLAYHLHGRPPLSRCAERYVDTRSQTPTIYRYPRVTLGSQPRPTDQPWGYFTAYTEVLYLNGSTWASWALREHSWPKEGLQSAGIPVAAKGQSSTTLPSNGPVTLDGPFTGAVNSGQPDSICAENVAGTHGVPLPAGVTSTHPAFSGAPGYYEVGHPTGAEATQAPMGVMLVIHGGAWATTGIGMVQNMRADADRWRARGWETVNLTYRPCGRSTADALWFYDKARAWFGARVKICALGTSAGGHLALLIGAHRPDLYCVINQAGPTDLRTIRNEGAYNAASGRDDQTSGPRWVHNIAVAAFGEENLPEYSPAAQASPTLKGTRVLQAFSADDPLVPHGQAADLADAMRAADPTAYVDSVQLAAGSIPFGHGLVSQAALDDFFDHEEQLVAPVSVPTLVSPRTR
ncbi:MAG: alpha/beta hydrolase [Actinomycetota bacterium]|nr:alpha/beta hydrolase [Actinomycetota bacterium]